MKILTARFISIAGHPFILLSLLLFLPRSQGEGVAFHTMLLFAAIVFVPLALLMWRCVQSGEWRTVDASDKADRPLLYKTALGVLLAAIAYFCFVEHSPSLVRGCVISAIMLLIAAAVNRWMKISLHLAFACFCGLLLARVRLSYGLPVLLLVPFLVWSRLVLSRHVISETSGGIVLGALGAGCFLWA